MSKAGKTVMVKNVAQSIPTFSMSCFLLPKSLCSEMEKMMNSCWWGSKGNNHKGIRWHAWRKMAVAKCNGGLGFRDLHGFNIALLGKHIWKFSTEPNSLVSRLFSARYYPGKHVLNALKGTGSSFIWQGIWEAKESLRKGFRWVLGNGEDVKAFNDPWLKGKANFLVEDNHLNGIRTESVCNYFRLGTNEWDVHKVMQDFHIDDVQHVLMTRIPRNGVKDRIAWTLSNTGVYTVKTGYQHWSVQNVESTQNSISNGWKNLWNVKVPHKFRTFVWRVCNNTLPVRNVLRSRGVNTTIICPMCDRDIEHLLHLFFDCPYAKDCWEKVDLKYELQDVESAPHWLLEKFSTGSNAELERITTVLWGIWFARNQKIWEKKIIMPAISMDISAKLIAEWQEAAKHKLLRMSFSLARKPQESRTKWHPPEVGRLKINVDASVFTGELSFKLGLVIRDCHGQFIRGRTMCINEPVSVLEAEARGVYEALCWCEELQLQNVSVESDSELVVKALNNDVQYYLEIGNSLDYCRSIFKHRDDLSLSHVRKQANHVAHLLARVPCLLNSSNEYLEPPDVLLETFCNELFD